MSIHGHGHLLTLAKGHLHIKFKTAFSQKHFTNQNQILYVVSLERGTKVYISGLGHMTKMAVMPIYVVKSFKNQLLWIQCSIGGSGPSWFI